ncbi:hypothetical protein M8C21_004391 [Ambrosia artemisiifolia]|uniref:Uncharacterized protein n=1 Tax=Ambrosia artemisiifolia TaxID=4212 RepID=A0AAD5G6Q2_AMBAR|nr:hypothetical protein M8C21_004391 [Ambrosia artemisiifolia]
MVYFADQGREGGHDGAQGIGADCGGFARHNRRDILDFGFTRADFGTDLAISNRT